VAEITETYFAPDRTTWRAWLEEFGTTKTEIWLIFLKRHVPEPSVTYDEAVEEALCFGWIDGILKRIDDRSHAVRFTPRKPRSIWSESNKARVARLIAEGRMTPTGMRPVETAKGNGMWHATTPERIDVTPPDLEEALAADPGAAERWRTWAPSHRRQYIYWVLDAKRPETRARRIADVVRRAAADIKANDM
jgi:uncharacterized protein YdeI (YjbR/CyaY-like superfamily)